MSFSQRLPQVKEEGATHWVGRPLARISFVAVLRCLTPPLPAPVQERRIVRSAVLGTSVAVLVAVALLASVAAVALHEPRQGEQRSAGRALARPHRPPGAIQVPLARLLPRLRRAQHVMAGAAKHRREPPLLGPRVDIVAHHASRDPSHWQ